MMTNSPLVGAERPRVELGPAFSRTFGRKASQIMRAARKPLDPWQDDGVDLMMAIDDDNQWLCKDYAEWVCRQVGKGVLLEARAVTGFLYLDGKEGRPLDSFIAWSAHEYKTAMEAFRRVNSVLRSLGTVISANLLEIDGIRIKINNTNGEESFERFDTDQRIRFIARSKGSGRGFTATTQLVDESFAYTDLHQDALAPTTIAISNDQTIYMSTPPLAGDTAQPMYRLRKRADAGGDARLGYRDWGLGGWLEHVDPEVAKLRDVKCIDVDDERVWAQCVPALGGRVSIDKLRIIRGKLGRESFAREVLGLWPTPVDELRAEDVISAEMWNAVADPESEIDGPPVFAIDMPWDRNSVVIAAGGMRTDGKHHVEIVEQQQGSFWVVAWLRQRILEHQPFAVLMDGNGPVASMLEDIEPLVEESGIDFIKVIGTEMTRACGEFYRDVHEDNLRHRNQAVLNTAIGCAVRKDYGDVWRWDRKDSSSDISPVVAATLADHGATIYADSGAFNIW
jgi:hypothetical protein